MNTLYSDLQNLYALHQRGDSISSEIGIRKLLHSTPNHPDILRLGALTALAINQIVTAQERLSKAASMVPMTAEMANTQGNIYKASGDWARAESSYLRAEEIDPTYSIATLNLLDMYLKSNQPHSVLKVLGRKVDLGELGDFAFCQAKMKLGQYDEALKGLDRNWASLDQDRIRSQRIEILALTNRFDELKTQFNAMPKSSPYMAQALGAIVNTLEMVGKKPEAMTIIAETLASNSTTAQTVVKASQLLNRVGDVEQSTRVVRLAQKRLTNDPTLLGQEARLMYKAENLEASCDLYKSALSIKPGDISLIMGYIEALISTKDFDMAGRLLQGAFRQAPNNQFLWALKATLNRMMGIDYKTLYNYKDFIRVYDIDPPKNYTDIENFNAQLKSSLERFHIYKHAPLNQSLRKGTQTNIDLTLVNDPLIRDFFVAMESPIRDFISQLPDNSTHPLSTRKCSKYRISGAWSVNLSENGHHVNHVHPMGWISSVYYVDVPKIINENSKAGWIKFGEPGMVLTGLTPERYIKPKPGRLVLFPSYMWHGTVPFKGPEKRLTLPFDVVPA